jgi:metal-sulfur cluster biosynthetic enzyme
MTCTTQFCLMGESIFFEAKQKLYKIFREYDIIVNLCFDQPWGPDRSHAKAKEFFK